MKKNKFLRHVAGFIAAFVIFGPLEMLIFCQDCFSEPYFLSNRFLNRIVLTGIMWSSLWKGSELIVYLLDQFLPWLKFPFLRLVASIVAVVVYVVILILVVDLIFDTLVLGKTFEETIQGTFTPILTVSLVTLGINVFMHGRGFLYSWRQSAIDMEKMKMQQINTQFQSLKNQVNPHFLFNSLNTLSSLVYEDQEKAVAFIRKLSQVYRFILENNEEVIPLEKELDFTQNFLYLQQLRFGDNLKVEIMTEHTNGHVPPLSLQLLVENAIKHNVVSEKDPLTIRIVVKKNVCSVINGIKEKLSKDSTGIGLENLKQRYRYLSNKEVEIVNDGKTFIVNLPILNLAE